MKFKIADCILGNDVEIKNHLTEVFNQQLLGVRIRHFYPKNACNLVSANFLDSDSVNWFEDKSYGGIGVSIYQVKNSSEYFERLRLERFYLDQLFSGCETTYDSLFNLLVKTSKTERAYNLAHSSFYSNCIVEARSRSRMLHVDIIDEISSQWCIRPRLDHEFSSVVYLQIPDSGGELVVFNKQKGLDHFQHLKFPEKGNNIAVNDSITEGIESITFYPNVGDLLIFNTSFYHKVLQNPANKLRIASFTSIGKTIDDELILFI